MLILQFQVLSVIGYLLANNTEMKKESVGLKFNLTSHTHDLSSVSPIYIQAGAIMHVINEYIVYFVYLLVSGLVPHCHLILV